MRMSFYWGYDVTFLFKRFNTNSDKPIFYFIGLIGCVLLQLVIHGLIRLKLKDTGKYKGISYLLEALICLLKIFSMLLAMTYNYGVIIAIVVGYSIGYSLLTQELGNCKDVDDHC